MIFQLLYKISKTLPHYCCGTHIITSDKTPPHILFGILDIPVSRVVLLFMTDAVAYHPDLPFRIEALIFSASKCNGNWHFTAEFHSGNRPCWKECPCPSGWAISKTGHFEGTNTWSFFFFPTIWAISEESSRPQSCKWNWMTTLCSSNTVQLIWTQPCFPHSLLAF